MSEENASVEASSEPVVENAEVSAEESVAEESGSVESEGAVEVQAETEAELEQEIKEAIDEGATEEEVKDMIRSFTLKVNGKEIVKEIDLSDEETLQRELQLAAAGRSAMQENAELKKIFEQEIGSLKNDPLGKMLEIGFSEEEAMEYFANKINEFVEKSQRPQEEIEAEKRAKEIEEAMKRAEEAEKKLKEKERQEQLKAMETQLENDIIDALDSDTDLPNTPEVIAMVADNMIWAIKNGFEDVTAKDVIPTVKKELETKFRSIASNLKSPAALKALLGDNVLKTLREERIEAAKKVPSVKELKKSVSSDEKPQQERKKIALSELFK